MNKVQLNAITRAQILSQIADENGSNSVALDEIKS